MASHQPHFVVVPGAWHQPEVYQKMLTPLRAAGYTAAVISLPSCNTKDPQEATCLADAEAVRKEILSLIEVGGKDVVVVCHSYGGIPGGGAAYGLSKIARAKTGKKGGVTGLVYVSGFVVPEGSSLLETMGGNHAPYVDPDQPSRGQSTIKGARDVLFNDLDDSEADRLTKLLRPTSMHAFDSPAPPVAWKESGFTGKLAFIRCMKDQALPPFLQDMFMEKSGVEWEVKDMETSHSPFASKPEELAKILGEFVQHFDK